MYIYWLGESSFKIKTDDCTIVIDPPAKETGLPQTTHKADLLLLSHTDLVNPDRVPGMTDEPPFRIDSPGEYEIHGAFVYGVPGPNNNVFFQIKADYITIAHLGQINATLDDKTLELLEGTDILLIPVGGDGLLSGKQADKIISQVEPRIVIPMNYALPKLNLKRDAVDLFLQEMGAEKLATETSLYITKDKLPEAETKIIVLEPQ